MRQTFLAIATATVLAAGAALLPASAVAMTIGTASGIQAAAAETAMLDEVRTVCRHRWRSSRRVCWWEPSRPRHRHWRSRRW